MPFNPHLFPKPLPPTHLPESYRDFIKKVYPKLGSNFEVLGGVKEGPITEHSILDDAQNYNCLGYVLERQQNLDSPNLWKDATLAAVFKQAGYEPVSKEEALIDVWYVGNDAKHVSRLDEKTKKWRSKLGRFVLIEHEREALEGSQFGQIKKHFGKPSHKPVAGPSDTPKPAHPPAPHPHQRVHEAMDDNDVAVVQDHAEDVHRIAMKARGSKPVPKATAKPGPKPTPKATPKPEPKPAPKPTPKPPHDPNAPHHDPKPPHTEPKPGHPDAGHPDTKGAHAFEAAFTAWKKTWNVPPAVFGSHEEDYTKSEAWKHVLALGSAVDALVVAKMTEPNNDLAVVLWKALNKHVNLHPGSLHEEAAQVVKMQARKHVATAGKVAAFAAHRDNVLAAADKEFQEQPGEQEFEDHQPHEGAPTQERLSIPRIPTGSLQAAGKLLHDPLFRQIIKEGPHSVYHILNEYAEGHGPHAKAIWEEGLKEIHAIEKKKGNLPEEIKEFDHWLSTYTGEQVE